MFLKAKPGYTFPIMQIRKIYPCRAKKTEILFFKLHYISKKLEYERLFVGEGWFGRFSDFRNFTAVRYPNKMLTLFIFQDFLIQQKIMLLAKIFLR